MSNITKNYKVGIFAMFIAAALVGSLLAINDNMAFATNKHNEAKQGIEQGQGSQQNGQCVSGDFTVLCGNNFNVQLQEQLGKLALGQQ